MSKIVFGLLVLLGLFLIGCSQAPSQSLPTGCNANDYPQYTNQLWVCDSVVDTNVGGTGQNFSGTAANRILYFSNTGVLNSTTTLPSAVMDGITRLGTITTAYRISNTTQSTSGTTGALVIDGGLGVGKDVAITGNLGVGVAPHTDRKINSEFVNLNPSSTKFSLYNVSEVSITSNCAFCGATGQRSIAIVGAANTANYTGDNQLRGLLAQVITRSGATGTVGEIVGVETQHELEGNTTTNAYGLLVQNTNVIAPATLGTQTGVAINNLTSATTDIGIYIAGADTYAIWVDSGVIRYDNSVAAPGTNAGVVIVNYYGQNPTNFLGDPVGWIEIDVNGTLRKVPFY